MSEHITPYAGTLASRDIVGERDARLIAAAPELAAFVRSDDLGILLDLATDTRCPYGGRCPDDELCIACAGGRVRRRVADIVARLNPPVALSL